MCLVTLWTVRQAGGAERHLIRQNVSSHDGQMKERLQKVRMHSFYSMLPFS